jgi:hypothetical protein
MPHRLSARDALSRLFPSNNPSIYNREMADRAIAWLAECGYQIVPKDQVKDQVTDQIMPAEPAAEERQRAAELH